MSELAVKLSGIEPVRQTETPLATDLLAGLLMQEADARPRKSAERRGLPLKVYGVMTFTTLTTFAALAASYQMLFSHSVFA